MRILFCSSTLKFVNLWMEIRFLHLQSKASGYQNSSDHFFAMLCNFFFRLLTSNFLCDHSISCDCKFVYSPTSVVSCPSDSLKAVLITVSPHFLMFLLLCQRKQKLNYVYISYEKWCKWWWINKRSCEDIILI